MNKFLLFIILFSIWLLLSGFFSPLFLFYGVASSLVTIFFFSKMLKIAGVELSRTKLRYFSFGFVSYVFWLIKEIIISSLNVATEMWKNEPLTKPYLKWIKHELKKDGSLTLYANSITLTPGTISMYVTDKEILVHALHEDGIEDLEKQGSMHDKIKNNIEK